MLTESGFFKENAPQSAPSSVPPDLVPGRRIAGDKYELVRKIGVGAMGEVWAAKHLSLEEEVAIKLVLRDIEHEDGSTADSRFLLEARVARMLSRKTRHVVSVTDHGDDGDMAYLVMELLKGEALDHRLARSGALPVEKVVPIVQQVARALSYAHAEGIVHRDLKPGNVFLTLDEDGDPLIKILDFGIAKLRTDDRKTKDEPALPLGITVAGAKHATLRGFLLGTPAFMSPEQAKGKPVDHRADVWALGVIAYHLLTAQFPFDGATATELFARLTRVQPFAITEYRKDLPPAVNALFERAFAKNIDERFESADELAKALELAAGNRVAVVFSMPPPTVPTIAPPTPEAPVVPPTRSEISAAGVPRTVSRQLVVASIFAIAAAIAFTVGYARFGRDANKHASGLTPPASKVETTGGAVALDRVNDVPAPEPVVAAPEPKAAEARAEPPPAEAPAAVPESAQVNAAPIAPAPPPAPIAAPPKPVDKSEVF